MIHPSVRCLNESDCSKCIPIIIIIQLIVWCMLCVGVLLVCIDSKQVRSFLVLCKACSVLVMLKAIGKVVLRLAPLIHLYPASYIAKKRLVIPFLCLTYNTTAEVMRILNLIRKRNKDASRACSFPFSLPPLFPSLIDDCSQAVCVYHVCIASRSCSCFSQEE